MLMNGEIVEKIKSKVNEYRPGILPVPLLPQPILSRSNPGFLKKLGQGGLLKRNFRRRGAVAPAGVAMPPSKKVLGEGEPVIYGPKKVIGV